MTDTNEINIDLETEGQADIPRSLTEIAEFAVNKQVEASVQRAIELVGSDTTIESDAPEDEVLIHSELEDSDGNGRRYFFIKRDVGVVTFFVYIGFLAPESAQFRIYVSDPELMDVDVAAVNQMFDDVKKVTGATEDDEADVEAE